MSEAGKENYRQFLKDSPKAEISGKWREGPRITFEYLKTCGDIVTMAQEFKAKEGYAVKKSAKPSTPGSLMGFGKYKDKTLLWVSTSDPRYWEWCCSDVGGFEDRAKSAGLLNMDPEYREDQEEIDRGL